MGTRADFYMGRGKNAEWLGSIAWDGNPAGIPLALRQVTEPESYRREVAAFLAGREDATLPEQGWPWPWNNSQTTDYSYAFDAGVVWASCFGNAWFFSFEEEDEDASEGAQVPFPDMSKRQKVTLGKRSGIIVIGKP